MLQAECCQCHIPTTLLRRANTIGNGSGELILDHPRDSVLSWGDVPYPEEVRGDGSIVEEETGVEDKGEEDDGEDSKGNGYIIKGGSHEGPYCCPT